MYNGARFARPIEVPRRFLNLTARNLLNLLLTKRGERVNHPGFGIGLQDYLFEQEIDRESVNEQIHKQIQFYIPEITLNNSDINFDPDEHTLTIKIIYEFNLDRTQDAILITV